MAIEIKPSHRGIFTDFADANGMTVLEAAKHVLANRDEYSPARVKQANFANNFAHKDGGKIAYNPNLANNDKGFQKWYSSNTLEGKAGTPYGENLDYDYYSFYRNKDKGDIKNHFPDTYKRPNHKTFSNQSIYSTPENPGGRWEGEKFIPYSKDGGEVVGYKKGGPTTGKQTKQQLTEAAMAGDPIAKLKLANGDYSTTYLAPSRTSKSSATPTQKTTEYEYLNSQSPDLNSNNDPSTEQEPVLKTDDQVQQGITSNTPGNVNSAVTSTLPTGTQKQPTGMDWKGLASSIVNYALPAYQIYQGNKYLQNAGPRPVDQIDPDYLKSVQAARNNLDIATANSKFGFTPEQQFQIAQQNQAALNQGRFAAKNYSGGSAGNAYNMDQEALNNSFNNGLAAKVASNNYMLQKQGQAMDKQGYLDDLITNKVELNRRLFNDRMNAYQQNQQVGGNLLGTGIANALGASRYNDEKNAYADINKKYGT